LPLLATKLYRPPVTPDLEQRTRLMERLPANGGPTLPAHRAVRGYYAMLAQRPQYPILNLEEDIVCHQLQRATQTGTAKPRAPKKAAA
jgi:hypothetical protein